VWWVAVDAAVWSVVVVPAQPAGEGFGAVVAGGVDEAVGPFALQDADECFCFAVCPGRVGAGAQVADVVGGEDVTERVGAIAGAVVGQDALDRCDPAPVSLTPASYAAWVAAGCV
jgi:hypothetical protein